MGLDSFQLKCIAVVTMIIDHIGAVIFPENIVWRYIGRVSFPVFCFLLTEGFVHTRDVKKYILRLAVFAAVSEIPYDLAFRNVILEFEHQNVFFTLAVGVWALYAIEKNTWWLARGSIILLAMWAAETLHSDYGLKGILLIMIYYFLREEKWPKIIFGALWNPLWGRIQSYGMLASIPIALYNGKKGPSMKYVFYGFYPVHLIILYVWARFFPYIS